MSLGVFIIVFLGIIIIIIALGIGWVCSDIFENISKLKKIFYYASGIDLLLFVLLIYEQSYYSQDLDIITIGGLSLSVCFLPILFLIGGIYFYASVISSAWNKLFPLSRTIPQHSKSKARLHSIMRLILSEEDEANIVGDLLEESAKFQSKRQANIWLYKQVLKSALPLFYKNLINRLASYFGKRIR